MMETDELIRLIDEDRLEELRERSAQDDAIDNAANALREFEERRRAALAPPDGLEQEASKLEEEYREAVASLRSAAERESRFDWTLPAPTEAPGSFQFVNASRGTMPPYFDVTERPEGGFYFTGRQGSVDANTLRFNVLVRAHFKLLELPPSASGGWVSWPAVDLGGNVWAETMRGSTSAECNLIRTQTLFQIVLGHRVPIASRSTEHVVVRSTSLGSKRMVLRGLYEMPLVHFAPEVAGSPIWSTLEVLFSGSVRGRTAEITLGTSPPHDGVVLQTPPWHASPL
jgi:hypothetical protein